MEKTPENPENQEFTRLDLDPAVHERNLQAMGEQAALARNATANAHAEELARQARADIETATNPDIITGIPEHLRPKN